MSMAREIAGRYELRGVLGTGAGATVHEAHDRLLDRRVAVKVVRLPPPDGAAASEEHARFRQGARAAARLTHPNIVPVFDYGEDAATAWIVMEIVEGETLEAVLAGGEGLPIVDVVRLAGQILDALEYSHARGVVHRDVKPANIMLTRDRTAKVTDFGVARIADSSMTYVGTMIGTPAYMSPEQLRGEAVDHRADVWAAGAVLYQMLTGQRPFDGSVTSVMQKALYSEPLPPSLRARVPGGFDAVVAKAMSKLPEDRFASAGEFAAAVRAAATSATAAASPASPGPPRTGAAAGPTATKVPASAAAPRWRTARPPARQALPRRRPSGLWTPTTAVVLGGCLAAAISAGFLLLGARPPPSTATPAASLPRERAPPVAEAAPPPSVNPAAAPDAASAPPSQPPAPAQEAPARPPERAAARPDSRTAALAALAAVRSAECGLLGASAEEDGTVSIAGVARRGEEAGVRRVLEAFGGQASAAKIRVEPFDDGPFCGVLAALRPDASPPDAAPRAELLSPNPLARGQNLRFRIEMPEWPAHLNVFYLTASGDVGHLVTSPPARDGAASRTFEDPAWKVVEPFGTDLLLVLASERAIFDQRRRPGRIGDFAPVLSSALRPAREAGRVAVRAITVETVPR